MTTATPDAAPAPAPAWPQRAAIGLRWIAGFIVAVLAWIGLQVLDVWPAWVLAAVVGLALVLALPIWLIRRARARGRPGWSAWRAYGSTALVVLALLILVLATPIYYLALRGELRPAAVPQAVLSNGPKTVVFQGMVHIGSEPYYKGMVYEVGKALTEGSALFYEGVIESPESPEATQWFKDTLAGGGDLSANYKAIGDLCGLTFQLDWFAPVEAHKKLHPEQHVNADLSYLEMYREYQRLAAADPGFAARVAAKQAKGADPTDAALTWVVGAAKGASQEQKDLVGGPVPRSVQPCLRAHGPQGRGHGPGDPGPAQPRPGQAHPGLARGAHLHHLRCCPHPRHPGRAAQARPGLGDQVPQMDPRHFRPRARPGRADRRRGPGGKPGAER